MIQKHVEILKKLNIEPKTILEIGSRDGDDSFYYKNEFNIKDEDVYVVEPNPSQAKEIRKKYPNFKLIELAIDNDEGEKDFYQVTGGGKDPIGISSLKERNDDWYDRFGMNKIKVTAIKGSTLMKIIDRDIDICKIDVEGLTYEVIESFGDSIQRIKSLHVESETHMYWKNQKLHTEVSELLNKLGFVEVWQQEQGGQADTIWLKKENMNDFKNVEIHTLICKKDLTLAVNNFKSLQKFEEFADMPVFLHDDGSLTEDDLPILNQIKNMEMIWRKDADIRIKEYVENHPYCMSYRLGTSHINLWHKIKSFDYFYFSKTKKILAMDTDLLFLRKPENVINLMKQEIPFYFPDIQSAYCFNEPKDEIKVIQNVNTGLIYIPSEEYYSIDAIEHALTNLIRKNINYFPSWIEQSAFAHMFYADGRYVSLSLDKYKIPYFQRVDIETAECLHFVSFEGVRNTYETYLNYINLGGKLVHDKEYKVKFKESEVPMLLKVYDDVDRVSFKFTWELQKANVQALDHIFEITTSKNKKESIFKFQSEKNGFFSIDKKDKVDVFIRHTYDWYGEQNWETLENMVI